MNLPKEVFDQGMYLMDSRWRHGKPIPKGWYYDLWLETFLHTPSRAWLEVTRKAVKRLRSPATIDDIEAALREWYSANPQSREGAVVIPCEACNGHGRLEYIKHVPSMAGQYSGNYLYECRCGHCENWKRELSYKVRRMTREQIEREGCKILESSRYVQEEEWLGYKPVEQGAGVRGGEMTRLGDML